MCAGRESRREFPLDRDEEEEEDDEEEEEEDDEEEEADREFPSMSLQDREEEEE